MTKLILSCLFVFGCLPLLAQTIIVQPYLQDASPNSIYIMWETDSMDESIVEWGLTNALGNSTSGIAEVSNGASRIHEVKLEGLQRFTKYFYSVQTGSATSTIFSFKTPPFASDNESFRIISMSDMQRDGSLPNKFSEIIHDGIIDYLNDEFGGELIDNLALVMIPGDLVVNGNDYTSWAQTFFTPAEDLFSAVPVYPVLGNHENNAVYYFKYFKMPENGTAGFEEHWWYKDYGNVRIIGLNSNNPFSNEEQLDWLEALLESTCNEPDIDFVFAQLHHPHKSELWTPGESPYTGEVIHLLEQFSTNCEKPSIHFFGHTHAYSRGSSRDHKHIWLNTATAGGAIDNWGEFPNADYDEFSVSQDEYGFVSVEITSDSDPKVIIRRISRGDQDITLDNDIRDSATIRLHPTSINSPLPVFPVNEEVIPECVTLVASQFSSPNSTAEHGQSHWQISDHPTDFSSPVDESWKSYQNWYFEVDTQADDDLFDEKFTNLSENQPYWWRVRYRDKELNWSAWSHPTGFSTAESVTLPNLLLNPGAENNLDSWTITQGVVEALTTGVCDGISPYEGVQYFAVGGLCDHSDVGILIQDVDVSTYASDIDMGVLPVNFGGHLSNFGGSDLPEMRLLFYNENNDEIGTSSTLFTLNNSWTDLTAALMIPQTTRSIRMELKGTRNAGTDNDSYFDTLFLYLGASLVDCNGTLSTSNYALNIPLLGVIPNPVRSDSYIELPSQNYTDVQLYVVDSSGRKVSVQFQLAGDKVILQIANLSPGVYFFWLKNQNYNIGKGKFVVQ
ncbi:MAG: hypothetical protein ACI828_001596 [Flavobacteriales bacterium]|jgi:hypothetical protein